MEFDYKGYKLQILISQSLPTVHPKYCLQGKCEEIGFDFFSNNINEDAFVKLATEFKEHVNHVNLQFKKLIWVLAEDNNKENN